MAHLILSKNDLKSMIRDRRKRGSDRFDEVWNGVYVMAPMANDEHQDFVSGLNTVLTVVVRWTKQGLVRPGVNVTDRRVNWTKNFRCPDVK